MKKIIYIVFSLFCFMQIANGATCTITSRDNYTSGQKLTSSALNADLNQLVTKLNAMDGGCLTDNSVEASALNSTDFATVTNGIHQGCTLSYSDANTISVGKCILSVNGSFVKTTAVNNVTWGCSGCSAEVASTLYYIYAKSGSSGTSLNLLISTTAPDADGYDALGNKVLGTFFNNSSSAIDQRAIKTWIVNRLSTQSQDVFTFGYGATASTVCSVVGVCAYLDQSGDHVLQVEKMFTGTYKITFRRTYQRIDCFPQGVDGASPFLPVPATALAANNATFSTYKVSPFALNDSVGAVHCIGVY